MALPEVELVGIAQDADRPSGRRFGVLVHAVLAHVPLDAQPLTIGEIAAVQGRILGADPAEILASARVAERVLAEPMLERARAAHRANRCRRETPVTVSTPDGTIVEGVIDLAFEDEAGWTVVDFKTDYELTRALDRYRRQVGLYADAIRRATDRDVRGVLMRV